jgi:transcriptional regulator with XRE-family HTH domain
MADIVNLFARRVRIERKKRGLSQEVLAGLAGLHRTYVGGLERGEINATLRSANRIACALDVGLAELLCDDKEHNLDSDGERDR